jgi:hypothetical protein
MPDTDKNEVTLAVLDNKLDYLKEELDEIKDKYATRRDLEAFASEFKLVRILVFGAAGMILVAAMTLIINVVKTVK